MKRIFFLLFAFTVSLTLLSTVYAQEEILAADNPIIVLETNQGNIEFELFPKIAPKACENMLGLIEKKYYDGMIFHRVIKGFMLQGGDPTRTGRGGQSL